MVHTFIELDHILYLNEAHAARRRFIFIWHESSEVYTRKEQHHLILCVALPHIREFPLNQIILISSLTQDFQA